MDNHRIVLQTVHEVMPIDPSPRDLLLFATVVTEGSFTRAARAHGITKQSVSDRISRLEASLGVRLLERTTRRLRLTEIGSLYVERCRRIAAEIEEANQEARSRQYQPSGVLRVSAPYLFGRRFLGPIVAAYAKEHANVAIELVLGDRRVDLLEDGFDLAIRVGALDDSSIASRKLGSVRSSTVASRRLLERTPLRRRADLAQVDLIGMRRDESWPIQGRRAPVRARIVVNDFEIACGLAVAGLGVAHLPELVTAEHLRAGRLVRVLESAPLLVPVFALFPSRQFLPIKVRAFVDQLAASPSWA